MPGPPLESLALEIERAAKGVGSYLALQGVTNIDRRKLKRIAEGKDASLTIRELRRLDEYLQSFGRGLARVFSPRGVVRLLAEHGDVLFISGSQPDEKNRRIDFSRWDVRTLREVLQSLNATGLGCHFRIEDVIHRAEAEKAFGRNCTVDRNEEWYHCLEDDGPSVVCLGSSKACHASEVMLARMAGLEEFVEAESLDDVPFAFIWADDDARAASHIGAFRRTVASLPDEVAGVVELRETIADRDRHACGFYDGERVRTVDRKPKEWDTYAAIAVQRRPGNQYWCVLAGATGPATLGAAMVLPNLIAELDADPASRLSKLVWAPVTVRVQSGEDLGYRCDERRIIGKPELEAPRVWPS